MYLSFFVYLLVNFIFIYQFDLFNYLSITFYLFIYLLVF